MQMDNSTGGKAPTLEALIGAALRRQFPGSRTYINGTSPTATTSRRSPTSTWVS
jgi:hypothetical protein